MPITIEQCLNLAECARVDRSLLPNHKGVVDRKLLARLAENRELLRAIGDDAAHEELCAELRAESTRISHALAAYE